MSFFHLGAYDPNKDYSGKYCLMFRFGDVDGVPHAHCTHKYLGAAPEQILEKCIQRVHLFHSKQGHQFSRKQAWDFDRFQLFGTEKDTPALERDSYDGMMLDLKHALDSLVPDKFPMYRPHVTLPAESKIRLLKLRPVEYALTEGPKTHATWRMGA